MRTYLQVLPQQEISWRLVCNDRHINDAIQAKKNSRQPQKRTVGLKSQRGGGEIASDFLNSKIAIVTGPMERCHRVGKFKNLFEIFPLQVGFPVKQAPASKPKIGLPHAPLC